MESGREEARPPSLPPSPEAPLDPEILNAIVSRINGRTQEAIRDDRPPSLPGFEWRRVPGAGWNLWQVLADDGRQKTARQVGHLGFDDWQELKARAVPSRSIGFNARGMVPAAGSAQISPPVGVSNEGAKTASHRSIQQKPATSAKPTNKPGKLQVEKSRGKDEAYTVKIGRLSRFRVRQTESGFSVIFTWKDDSSGRWIERYACYLSRPEWTQSKRKSLPDFAALVASKVDPAKAELIERINVLTKEGDE